jgi:alpha-amylase/alpha-mannosidase (GH57 family)
MQRCICFHGHFYQPPRENPWLEAVELQDSAHPYHDWNERVTAECYGPNSASRVLNPDGRIVDIMNNYSRISFNFGPTLLRWLEGAQPEIYDAIVEADRRSREIHGGHGSALAQVYNHVIMPLCATRDRVTQIRWGIRDFEHRFGREPEGMWLAETAVDLETLDLLAAEGIRFTILAPRQARRVRRIGSEDGFADVSGERVDPRRPYLCRLPSGRTITLFFYDGHIAREVAFEGLLHNGEALAARMLEGFSEADEPQLVHIATDGESYGHHHHRGEMALTYCLHHIEANQLATVTVYGQYLEEHPPEWEAEIHERTSWSCVHGVERWRADCGCRSGRPGWHQRWRAPLRETLDWLRDQLAPLFEQAAGRLFPEPWAARDDYIEVVLDRTPEHVLEFLAEHAGRILLPDEQVQALRLLEMQRHAMLMFTSCGWFFDELSGTEATQILRYASRAVQLARLVGGPDLEPELCQRLAEAPSNLAEHGDGRAVYDRLVKPARTGLRRVGAHFAISSLFQDFDEEDSIYAFSVRTLHSERLEAGKLRLVLGRIEVQSQLTWDRADLAYAVLHTGDQNLTGGVRPFPDDDAFGRMLEELRGPFNQGDLAETIRVLDRQFQTNRYSLWHLFRDQQRAILEHIFEEVEQRIEAFYRQVYQDHYHLVQSMVQMSARPPAIFNATADFVVNRDLIECLQTDPIDEGRLEHLLGEIDKWSVEVDRALLGLLGSGQIEERVQRLQESPLDGAVLDEIEQLVGIYTRLDARLNLWRSQNAIYGIGLEQFFLRSRMAERGDESSRRWVERFKRVARLLDVRFD